MTDVMTFAPPVAYGVNATGGMNPCFKETMEVLTANHYSGALVFPKAGVGAVLREAPPPRGNRNEAQQQPDCAQHRRPRRDDADNRDGLRRPLLRVPAEARSLGFLDSPSGRARGLADHHEVFPTFNCDCGGAVCVYGG